MHTTIHAEPGQLPGITKATRIAGDRVCVYLADVDIYAEAAALRDWLTGTLEALDSLTLLEVG